MRRSKGIEGCCFGALCRYVVLCVALSVVTVLCSGCLKPPETRSEDNGGNSASESPAQPVGYYKGYWVCCGYAENGKIISFDTLSKEEKRAFPHIILEMGDTQGQVYQFLEGESYPTILLVGELVASPNGVKVDEERLGGQGVVEFALDGEILALQQDNAAVLEKCARRWLGDDYALLRHGSSPLYFERQDFGSQLYVTTIDFDGLSFDVPSDVTYLYDENKPEGLNYVSARSFRPEGPELTMYSSPTDAQDIIELAGDDYYGHEDEFKTHNGITYSIFRYEGDSLSSTFLQFVANGKSYAIDFSYDPEHDPVDYSDYAENFYATIKVAGGTSDEEPEDGVPAGAISWQEASQHAGETVMVYGPVREVDYASTSNGQPTFVDLGAAYPDPSRVTIVIWGEDRGAFPDNPETMYAGKTLCVTGELYIHEGVCNIKVTSPSQVQVIEV